VIQFDAFKKRRLNEKHPTATWKFENVSAPAIEQRKARKLASM
jgi:hypothetical protein